VSVGHLVKSLSVFTWLVEGGGFVFLRLHALGTLLSSWCLWCQCLQITKRWCKGQRIDNIWWRHHYHCVSCEYPVLTCYHTLSVIPSALCIPSREMLLSLLSRTLRSSLLANLQRCVQCAVGFCNVVMCIFDVQRGPKVWWMLLLYLSKQSSIFRCFFYMLNVNHVLFMAHQIKKLNLERNCSYSVANYLEKPYESGEVNRIVWFFWT
jgi:hypothetical protein